MKRKLALIGKDISYSLSPMIHGEIFREMDYDATYELFSVDVAELPMLVEKLKSEYVGFNVTKPHKQNILPFLDDCDLKSVNTVRVDGDKLHGASTDGYGFSRDLKIRFGEKIKGTALVLGAGGVARVIAPELKKIGFDVYIRNRTVSKAEELAAELGLKVADESVKPDLIVNCTTRTGATGGFSTTRESSGCTTQSTRRPSRTSSRASRRRSAQTGWAC